MVQLIPPVCVCVRTLLLIEAILLYIIVCVYNGFGTRGRCFPLCLSLSFLFNTDVTVIVVVVVVVLVAVA